MQDGKIINHEEGYIEIVKSNISLIDYSTTITQNISIKPYFTSEIQVYTATFITNFVTYYQNTKTIVEPLVVSARYGTNIYDLFNENSKYIPYKLQDEPNGDNLYKTNIFTGWNYYEDDNPLSVDTILDDNRVFYPCFEEGNIFDLRNIHRIN